MILFSYFACYRNNRLFLSVELFLKWTLIDYFILENYGMKLTTAILSLLWSTDSFLLLFFFYILFWCFPDSSCNQSWAKVLCLHQRRTFVRAPQKRSMPDTFAFRHLMILYHLNNIEIRPMIWVRIFRSKWFHELSTQD